MFLVVLIMSVVRQHGNRRRPFRRVWLKHMPVGAVAALVAGIVVASPSAVRPADAAPTVNQPRQVESAFVWEESNFCVGNLSIIEFNGTPSLSTRLTTRVQARRDLFPIGGVPLIPCALSKSEPPGDLAVRAYIFVYIPNKAKWAVCGWYGFDHNAGTTSTLRKSYNLRHSWVQEHCRPSGDCIEIQNLSRTLVWHNADWKGGNLLSGPLYLFGQPGCRADTDFSATNWVDADGEVLRSGAGVLRGDGHRRLHLQARRAGRSA